MFIIRFLLYWNCISYSHRLDKIVISANEILSGRATVLQALDCSAPNNIQLNKNKMEWKRSTKLHTIGWRSSSFIALCHSGGQQKTIRRSKWYVDELICSQLSLNSWSLLSIAFVSISIFFFFFCIFIVVPPHVRRLYAIIILVSNHCERVEDYCSQL